MVANPGQGTLAPAGATRQPPAVEAQLAAPLLSVVVLTYNEEANIGACLAALARQSRRDFEVIVVDAASTDRTVRVVQGTAPGFPVPLRIDVAPTRIPVGPARNRGAELALADAVAFLSADTEPSPDWVARALETLRDADLVFGRQVHAPPKASVPALVRGLRYHFPDRPVPDPATYASHVNAAMRRKILLDFPIGSTLAASAVDDVLLARRAQEAGYRLAYDPGMVVRHHDVATWRQELAKNVREGRGLGEYANELGVRTDPLAWGAVVALGLALLVLLPGPGSIALLALGLWAPAVRRAWRRRGRIPPAQAAVGVLFSPIFDATFLAAYVRGLLLRKTHAKPPIGRKVQA